MYSGTFGKLRKAALLATIIALPVMSGCDRIRSSTPQQHIQKAKDFLDKGDQRASIIELKNALQQNPDNAEARLLLGEIYIKVQQGKDAEKELLRAQKLGVDEESVKVLLGQALLLQQSYERILKEITPSSRTSPKNMAKIQQLQGEAQLGLGHPEQGCEQFKQSALTDPNYVPTYWGLAKCSAATKDFDQAKALLEQALKLDAKNADTWMWLGKLAQARNDPKAAEAAYSDALKFAPNHVDAHLSLAFLHLSAGKFDTAQTEISAARKLAPHNLQAIHLQALLDFRQAKYAAALESLQQVLRSAPEHMPSLLLAGAVQYALGSTEQAEQHLKKYLEKDPNDIYARKLLATVLLKNNQAQRALDILAPALIEAKQDAHPFALAGESYMQLKNYAKATEYFEKASALDPTAAQLHTALGMSKLGLGEDARAVAELEKATSIDAKSSKAGILLAMTHLRLKEYDKALATLNALEKEQPDNPLIQNLKGTVHLSNKDVPGARASFQKALFLQPAYFPAVANLVQLDVQEKKPDVAKKRLEAILEKDKKNVQVMTALAGLAFSQKQITEATTWLENSCKENPDAIQPAMVLVTHYLRIGEKRKALTLAQKFQGANPNNPEILDILAQAQFANGDKPGALATYNKLGALKPDSAPTQFRIATIHTAMQNQSEALSALKRALALQPDYLDAQLALATLESSKGNHAQALAIAQQIQKTNRKSSVGYELEGNLLISQNKPDLAVNAYEQAFAINKSGPLLVKLHASLIQAGKNKIADSRLTQWLKEHPADILTRMYQAGIYLANKQNKAAIDQYQTVLLQNPNNIQVLNNLAWLYQQEKDPRALEYAEKANKLAPDSPAILDTLGWILVEKGDTARGLPLLQKATSLAAEAAEIRYHLVLGLIKSGDKARARKELEHLFATGKSFSGIEEAKALLKQL